MPLKTSQDWDINTGWSQNSCFYIIDILESEVLQREFLDLFISLGIWKKSQTHQSIHGTFLSQSMRKTHLKTTAFKISIVKFHSNRHHHETFTFDYLNQNSSFLSHKFSDILFWNVLNKHVSICINVQNRNLN